jgi:hypothetical protein
VGANNYEWVGEACHCVRRCNKGDGICHRSRSNTVVGGGKPAVMYLLSKNLEPANCIGSLGEVGHQFVLLRELEPFLPVCAGGSVLTIRDSRLHRFLDKASIVAEFILCCSRQSFHCG